MSLSGCTEQQKSDVLPASDDSAQEELTEVRLARVNEIKTEQKILDQTLWKPEVEAQQHEQIFIELWDEIRPAQDKLAVLANFAFNRLFLPVTSTEEELELGIKTTEWLADSDREYDSAAWAAAVESFRSLDTTIIDTEWHHSRFVPASGDPAESTISFVIHAKSSEKRFRVTGKLDVKWMMTDADESDGSVVAGKPEIDEIHVRDLKVLEKPSEGLFKRTLSIPISGSMRRPAPLCHDLNADGLVDILVPASNTLLWNRGKGDFEKEELFEDPPQFQPGLQIADFDGDRHVDLIGATKEGSLLMFRGDGQGKFVEKAHLCADIKPSHTLGMTSGDIDGDGDLDLWVTQRSRVAKTNIMPQPYYDANNGWPSYLLRNDGLGNFEEATEEAGLSAKRNRWTFLATLVDLDDDGDLDLVNMSDFSGLDIFENDGKGRFRDVTNELIDNRYFFGMGLAFADFNRDARLDFFGTGMASTTVRRLEQLGLMREDQPDRVQMRMAMGYGNRLYFRDAERFEEDPLTASTVGRTGWSWGAATLDFDLDGDQDLYVCNGYRSGNSCRDYCTRYWTHDVFLEDSGLALKDLMTDVQKDLKDNQISWNGFEHNALLMNRTDGSFLNVAALFDSAFVYDSRTAISEDFDSDGRPDLLVTQVIYQGPNKNTKDFLHVYLNQLETGHDWIGFQVENGGPGLSPIGATVRIETDSGSQKQWLTTGDTLFGQGSFTAHFGLGDDRSVKAVTVRWPNGHVRRLEAPTVGRYHRLRPETSSTQSTELSTSSKRAAD